MYIAAAAEANRTLAEAGKEPDWLGDALCNGGEHGTRHHAVNRAWQRALAAVATGSVLLGDKEEKDKYKMYNEGYVPDLVRPGASAWGTDWIGESKVASPLTKGGPGTGCQDVGHTHANDKGNTEESLRQHQGEPTAHRAGLPQARRARRRPVQPRHGPGLRRVSRR